MAEYIKRETLLERAEYDNNYRLIIPAEAIKAAPAADVTPVVRRKDCAHLYGTMCAACGLLPRKPNDFCSRGERRDGDTDNGV